jgi:transcriptional regulator CtsR
MLGQPLLKKVLKMSLEIITDSIEQQAYIAYIQKLLQTSILTEQEKLRLYENLSYCIEYPDTILDLTELISADLPIYDD